jgi:hypothetical protein
MGSDKPRTFAELVAVLDPEVRASLGHSERFDDPAVSIPGLRQVTLFQDDDGTSEWRTEYFDDTVVAMSLCLPDQRHNGGRENTLML